MTKAEIKKLDRYYLRKYSINWRQRQAIFKKQRGRCALCNKHEREFKRRLHVDHDHITKEVRGLLCFYCNRRRVGQLNVHWAWQVYCYLAKYE